MTDQPDTPAQSVSVYPGALLRVTSGANMGDGLGFAAELSLDDVYGLSPMALPRRLSLHVAAPSRFVVAHDSDVGQPGASLHLDACLTFMNGKAETAECLVLVEVDAAGGIVAIFALPLAPLVATQDYVLVGIDTEGAAARFARTGTVAFLRGTHIALASGEQRRIEDLSVDDIVLTRDAGPQALRWVGMTTLRATGEDAPICISAGALNNQHDLVVSPDHRLFIYQRSDPLETGRSEVLVRARHLVNDRSVTRLDGGFVDYFQLLFDDHQIIYAEGIAAETLLIDSRTRAALPEGIVVDDHDTGASRLELPEAALKHPELVEMLRRASRG